MPGDEQLADVLLGDEAIDGKHGRGRKNRAERPAGGDHAGGEGLRAAPCYGSMAVVGGVGGLNPPTRTVNPPTRNINLDYAGALFNKCDPVGVDLSSSLSVDRPLMDKK